MFRDEYKYAVIEEKDDTQRAAEEELKVEDAVKRKQLQTQRTDRKFYATTTALSGGLFSNIVNNSRCEKADAKPATARINALPAERKVKTSRTGTVASRVSQTRGGGNNNKRFNLDYVAAQTIKNNYRSFGGDRGKLIRKRLKTARTFSSDSLLSPSAAAMSENSLSELCAKLKAVPTIQSLILKYRYDLPRMAELVKTFWRLHKISTFILTHSAEVKKATSSSQLMKKPKIDDNTVKRLLEITALTPAEQSEYLSRSDYVSLSVLPHVLRLAIKKLQSLPAIGFNQILKGIDIADSATAVISLEQFIKIHYFFIDSKASLTEYVTFGAKFLETSQSPPVSGSGSDLEAVTKLLHAIAVKGEDDKRGEMLVKALLANFVLCGVFDSKNGGRFDRAQFEKVFVEGKMNISHFVKIMLG